MSTLNNHFRWKNRQCVEAGEQDRRDHDGLIASIPVMPYTRGILFHWKTDGIFGHVLAQLVRYLLNWGPLPSLTNGGRS